jgi:hypothetical protein
LTLNYCYNRKVRYIFDIKLLLQYDIRYGHDMEADRRIAAEGLIIPTQAGTLLNKKGKT